jgi:hypothetical protein
MTYYVERGRSPRRSDRSRLRRIGYFAWRILRAVLVAGATFGPSIPPPPPPPPQTTHVRAEQASSDEDD